MPGQSNTYDRASRPLRVTRRRWLAAAMAVGSAPWLLDLGNARADVDADAAVDDEVAQVQARGRKAGLDPFRWSVTAHMLGIGDAADDYRNSALKRSEALAAAYLKYFQDKGFAVALPPRRLTAVTLKEKRSYAAFLGEEPGDDVGGHYDLESNRLVIFDLRGGGIEAVGASLERVNSLTLSHETTHQLTFNTGMLDRQGDVPLAVSEGLAMYAELWRPAGGSGSAIGTTNRPRLGVLLGGGSEAQAWIPLDKLLTDDELFHNESTQQHACAEAWVLVHYALKTPAVLPRFRAYLDAIRPRRNASARLADATAQLGDLGRLDLAVRKYVRALAR